MAGIQVAGAFEINARCLIGSSTITCKLSHEIRVRFGRISNSGPNLRIEAEERPRIMADREYYKMPTRLDIHPPQRNE